MRYTVEKGSSTAHCCFEASVLDTDTPVRNLYDGSIVREATCICECFEVEQAERIAKLLNEAND